MSGMSKAKDSIALHVDLVTGSTAAADLTLTGIAAEDTIIFAGHFSTLASIATLVDDTANVTIGAAGDVINSATDTSSDQLLVIWNDNSA